MDRKHLRRFLCLSCCVNVGLCLFFLLPLRDRQLLAGVSPEEAFFPRQRLQDVHRSFSKKTGQNAAGTGKKTNISTATTSAKDRGDNKGETRDSGYDHSIGMWFYAKSPPPRDVWELAGRMVPSLVVYVWCGKHPFRFRDFLSVFSIWRDLEPDGIEIHYEFLPLEDKYNTWLSWLRANIPSLSLHSLPPHVTGSRCQPSSFGLEILVDRGGVFLANGVVLHSVMPRNRMSAVLHASRDGVPHNVPRNSTASRDGVPHNVPRNSTASRDGVPHNAPRNSTASRDGVPHNAPRNSTASRDGLASLLQAPRTVSFLPDGNLAMIAAPAHDVALKFYLAQHATNINSPLKSLSAHLSSFKDTLVLQCRGSELATNYETGKLQQNKKITENSSTSTTRQQRILCDNLPDSLHSWGLSLLWSDSLKNNLERIVNDYSADHTDPVVSYDKLLPSIPNIIHYVWFGRKEMTLSMYLSFLSSAYIAKPSAVFIHTDHQLFGQYWDKTVKHPLVCLVYRERPSFIYQRRVLYRQHGSDVVRADILDKYGGIYLDWDAFWLKSPRDLLNTSYDIILSRDHMPRPPFPETINMGVALAKPRSKFIRAWRAAWVNYRSHDFLYNAVELPFKIFELFPSSTWLHDRLQVMCYFLKCHPLFHPDHKQWSRSQPFRWETDVYVIHFTHPEPPPFHNETALRSGKGMFADIAKFIWQQGHLQPTS